MHYFTHYVRVICATADVSPHWIQLQASVESPGRSALFVWCVSNH